MRKKRLMIAIACIVLSGGVNNTLAETICAASKSLYGFFPCCEKNTITAIPTKMIQAIAIINLFFLMEQASCSSLLLV